MINRRVVVLAVIVAFALAASGISQPPAGAAQAGRIDAIAPSCAVVGAQVTLTGNGFGAHNVRITLGGLPAQVVAATGNRVTFVVPPGMTLGATTVTATNPGGHVGSVPFSVCDLQLPAAWAGQWQVSITYRDAGTGELKATYDITTTLGAGEPFGLSPIVRRADCSGLVTDSELDVDCDAQAATPLCTAAGDTRIAIARSGETLSGGGLVSFSVNGTCGSLRSSALSIEVVGTRLGQDGSPPGPSDSLLSSFVPHASVLERLP